MNLPILQWNIFECKYHFESKIELILECIVLVYICVFFLISWSSWNCIHFIFFQMSLFFFYRYSSSWFHSYVRWNFSSITINKKEILFIRLDYDVVYLLWLRDFSYILCFNWIGDNYFTFNFSSNAKISRFFGFDLPTHDTQNYRFIIALFSSSFFSSSLHLKSRIESCVFTAKLWFYEWKLFFFLCR